MMSTLHSGVQKPSSGSSSSSKASEALEGKTIKQLVHNSLKRSHELFSGNFGEKLPTDALSLTAKMACKIRDEYASVENTALRPSDTVAATPDTSHADRQEPPAKEHKSSISRMIDAMPGAANKREEEQTLAVVLGGSLAASKRPTSSRAVTTLPGGGAKPYTPSAIVQKRLASRWPKPVWHAPWRCYRVLAGHAGWVRSVAFDPGNEWFVTGGGDRVIKVWDLASGQLKLTLTGHIEQVTGVAIHPRSPYMFSCSLDKNVKCWDLETNTVIRQYHGHLSGVYALAMHPTLDVLFTGGRDSSCRVWDMRTRVQVHCLTGHDQTVCSILSQASDPQVVTGSHDSTIKLWDLRKHTTFSTLTYHKKSVRAMALHPKEYAFMGASADNIKKYKLPRGEFLHNTLQHQKAIINSCAVNEDNVAVTGGDNGSLHFWDWRSGNRFQEQQTIVQPGSMESESGILAMSFDVTGSRLVTCEADKTVKLWREDTTATPETHPVNFKPPRDIKRY